MKKKLPVLLGVIMVPVFLIAVFTFFTGSLEAFPTPEQAEKTRIASAAVAVICAAVEYAVIRLMHRR